MTDLTSDRRAKAMHIQDSKGLDPLFFPESLFNSSFVAIFAILTEGILYNEYRDDQMFPAMHEQRGRQSGRYSNEADPPGLLGCVDNAFICDPDLDQCTNWPKQTPNLARKISDPISGEFDGVLTEADHARVLLSSAIFESFEGMVDGIGENLEAKSHCEGAFCYGLPREQWKVEARQMFETSLARIQNRVLDIVRGVEVDNVGNYSVEDYYILDTYWNTVAPLTTNDIPPNLRQICHMGKFTSIGWRNVSVWGLIGLLSLCGAIALASITTENNELWLILGARLLTHALRWGISPVAVALASMSKKILPFVSTFPLKRSASVARARQEASNA